MNNEIKKINSFINKIKKNIEVIDGKGYIETNIGYIKYIKNNFIKSVEIFNFDGDLYGITVHNDYIEEYLLHRICNRETFKKTFLLSQKCIIIESEHNKLFVTDDLSSLIVNGKFAVLFDERGKIININRKIIDDRTSSKLRESMLFSSNYFLTNMIDNEMEILANHKKQLKKVKAQ